MATITSRASARNSEFSSADWIDVLGGAHALVALAVGEISMDDTLERACRQADRKAMSRPRDLRLERLRRLVPDEVPLERIWHELQPRGVAASTLEALMYLLRRGIGELTQPDTLRRLSMLTEGQLKAVCRRVQSFNPEIATPWSSDEVAALIAKWRELHERR
jgi:hypothetical protein